MACSFPSVPRILTLIMIFSSRSYLVVRIRYGGFSSFATGFSLGWLLLRLIPEGRRFPTVLVPELLPLPQPFLRMWLPPLCMAAGTHFSLDAGIPSKSVPASRSCNIPGLSGFVPALSSGLAPQTGIFLWRLGPWAPGPGGGIPWSSHYVVVCVRGRPAVVHSCVVLVCCIACYRSRLLYWRIT